MCVCEIYLFLSYQIFQYLLFSLFFRPSKARIEIEFDWECYLSNYFGPNAETTDFNYIKFWTAFDRIQGVIKLLSQLWVFQIMMSQLSLQIWKQWLIDVLIHVSVKVDKLLTKLLILQLMMIPKEIMVNIILIIQKLFQTFLISKLFQTLFQNLFKHSLFQNFWVKKLFKYRMIWSNNDSYEIVYNIND